jgi:hypothetical protein
MPPEPPAMLRPNPPIWPDPNPAWPPPSPPLPRAYALSKPRLPLRTASDETTIAILRNLDPVILIPRWKALMLVNAAARAHCHSNNQKYPVRFADIAGKVPSLRFLAAGELMRARSHKAIFRSARASRRRRVIKPPQPADLSRCPAASFSPASRC